MVEFFRVENIRRLLVTTLYFRHNSFSYSFQHFVAEQNLNTLTKEAAHSSEMLEQIYDHICFENSEGYYFINTSCGSPKYKSIIVKGCFERRMEFLVETHPLPVPNTFDETLKFPVLYVVLARI